MNQRETTVVWERGSSRLVHPAIVWQDRRTAAQLRGAALDPIRRRTRLVPDPYFSATKLEWILARTTGPRGSLAFGTVDSWLVWKLTGAPHTSPTAPTPRARCCSTSRPASGTTSCSRCSASTGRCCRRSSPRRAWSARHPSRATVPIAGIAGDQQAALFWQACFAPGEAKATWPTGTFVLVALGEEVGEPTEGLLTTAAAERGLAALRRRGLGARAAPPFSGSATASA